MEEITGPILAITLVLCAVFVPCAFIPGITGRFFQQFAVTISASMIISAVNAMTMTPSRAMLIFKARNGSGRTDLQSVPPTPGRIANPSHHGHRAEVLPWWSLGLAGAALTVWLWPLLAFTQKLGLPELPHGEAVTRLPDWLLQTLSLDPTILPPVLTESSVPAWLYWTITVLHALPGLFAGLLAGWFVTRPMNAVLGWLLRGFNRAFDGLTTFYGWTIGLALRGAPWCCWSTLVWSV